MTDLAACAAALAGLPGMGPATLVRLLTARDPAEAWQLVRSGAIVRPAPGRPSAPTGPQLGGSPQVGTEGDGSEAGGSEAGGSKAMPSNGPVSATLPWDDLDTEPPVAAKAHRMAPGASWARVAAGVDPEEEATAFRHRGIEVTWWGDRRYPAALAGDPEPPGVLFWRGELDWLERPTVALVGTRRCTHDGRVTAFELGRDLAAAGVCVVSGLALGVDGAAHTGALSVDGAGTVGVAASGVDVAYPRAHAGLWERVVGHGAVCSETPPGRPAQAWRFPSRNRVIAGLSRVVVVVESHAGGGSLITAEAAIRRGIDVLAVPGPVRSPASEGTNQLLADGPGPVRHAGDVLDALGAVARWPPEGLHLRPRRPRPAPPAVPPGPGTPAPGAVPVRRSGRTGGTDHRPAVPGRPSPADGDELGVPGTVAARVLAAVGHRPVTLNQVVRASGLAVSQVDAALDRLEGAGLVVVDGSWWCRTIPQ